MNDADKALARKALEQKWITIDEVEAIRAEVDRTGRTFREVATAKGKLKGKDVPAPRPAPKIPPMYLAMLAASFVIFTGLLISSTVQMSERSRKDDELAVATSKNMAEADRKSAEAKLAYQRMLVENREARARAGLALARASMTAADEKLRRDPATKDAVKNLNDAFSGYNTYLEILPDDAGVRIERARVHELRGNYSWAIDDLERAVELRRDLEPAVKERITQLKLLLPRKPQ